ncbi:hypothetical protein CsatB_026717 [Cannabis sativa]
MRNLENSFLNTENKESKVKITLDDIEDEISFWKPSIVCYVLGVNPPLHILDGFVHRIWQGKVDRVKVLSYGIFIIRFHSIEDRDQVLNGGFIFFNRRPVVMRPWDPNESFKKDDMKSVPIWIQLEELELKYWGQKSLFKIVGQMGKPIMVDNVTKERERLNFPRVLIEVQMDQDLPAFLEFENEFGSITSVGIKYEWKPISCSHCSGIGHAATDCKKKMGGQQQWIIKKDNRKMPQVDEEGFTKVHSRKNTATREQGTTGTTETNGVIMKNSFQGLEEDEIIEIAVENMPTEIVKTGEGGAPSLSNG